MGRFAANIVKKNVTGTANPSGRQNVGPDPAGALSGSSMNQKP